MRPLSWLGLPLACVAGCGLSQPPKVVSVSTTEGKAAEQARLQVVKWPDLEQAIAAKKGHVVVIDVWAEW